MKNLNKSLIFALIFLLFTTSTFSQAILPAFDSLPVSKPKLMKQRYELNRPSIKEVSIVLRDPKQAEEIPKKFWENFAKGVLSLSTGIITTTNKESLWMTLNELNTNDLNTTWRIPLYFHGIYRKSHERVKESDGSVSLETEKGLYPDWSQEAYGYILEKTDSLGKFILRTDLRNDTVSQEWLRKIETEAGWVMNKLKKYEHFQMNYNFALSGIFKNRTFYIIHSGTHYRSLVILDDNPVAIFQSDPDFITLNKKDRIFPYTLIKKGLSEPEITDVLRLALLDRLISLYIGTDYYKM